MGDNNAVIVQILAVVLFLGFCFVTYLNTKTWRVPHVTFMFLVFAASMAFSVYAALTLKTRRAWQKTVQELETKLASQSADTRLKLHGDPKLPRDTWGVRDYRAALDREIVDRGRVWRNVTLLDAQPQDADPTTGEATAVVKLSTELPGALPGAPVKPNNMEANTVVYAFKDVSAPNTQHAAYVYLGEFSATAVTDTTVTLTSTSPISKFDQNFIGGNEPWILYDRMPTDSHQVFTANGLKPSDVLREADFATPEAYQATLREYNRDGMTLEQMTEDRKTHNDPPLSPEELRSRMFAKVKFLKEHTVDVDAPAPRAAASGDDVGRFDLSGQALDPRLLRGEKKTFKVGEEAEIILHGFSENGAVIERGAEELAKEGIVEILQTVYRRPLHDYAYEFQHIAARRNQIRASLRNVLYEMSVVQDELKNAEANTAARREEKGKLAEDQTRLLAETKKIAEYADKVQAAYREARAELSRLYRENVALHERIVAANESLTRQIEAREAAPASLER
jgi:hypothetical protein